MPKNSLGLTHRWLERGLKQFHETDPLYGHSQAFFPIVQGSVFPELRKESAEFIAEKGAVGNAIGGLSVGEPAEEMYAMLEVVNAILPEDRPRYLMGVGTPVNILEAISLGVDMFDCVMPTRNGRNGMLFTAEGIINIKNRKWMDDYSPSGPGRSLFCGHAIFQSLFASFNYIGRDAWSTDCQSCTTWHFTSGWSGRHLMKSKVEHSATWKEKMIPALSTRL